MKLTFNEWAGIQSLCTHNCQSIPEKDRGQEDYFPLGKIGRVCQILSLSQSAVCCVRASFPTLVFFFLQFIFHRQTFAKYFHCYLYCSQFVDQMDNIFYPDPSEISSPENSLLLSNYVSELYCTFLDQTSQSASQKNK